MIRSNAVRTRRPTTVFVAVILALSTTAVERAAAAAPYRFQVEEMKLQAHVLPDASVRLDYEIHFLNAPGAHPIDIVDVGLPHSRYRIATMSAFLDESQLHSIRPSSYIDIGVEVDLGSHAIPPGQRGVFRFQCTMPDMVFADTTDKEYASVQIRPTWFDTNLQTGTTHLQVAIHLPPGVSASELRFQDETQRYSDLVDNWGDGDEQHAVALWSSPQFTLSERNPKFSVSFPRRVMERVVEKTTLDLFVEWFAGNPTVQLWSGGLILLLLAFTFFRFSHGTGVVVYLILAAIAAGTMATSPGLHLLLWPLVIVLAVWNERYLRHRRQTRTTTYLPAMATVEGGGIKRGLTAPQAAVLLQLPLSKVLTMVIFGLLKKGVCQLVKEEPLTLTVTSEFKTTKSNRLKVAALQGIVLHDYEHPFLDRLMMHDAPVERCDLNAPMGELIQSVVDRMKGFDLNATREYYRRIVSRALQEAKTIGEAKMKEEVVDRNVEWIMIDPKWTVVLDDWNRRGYEYRPRWYRTTIPRRTVVIGPGTRPSPSTSSPSSKGSSPTLSEVAGSFAGWAENTTGRLASMLEPAAMGLKIPAGRGIVDLSGVDRVTGDIFEALAKSAASSGRGGGGGGGGGCACACAGCACACACAGGGR